MLKSYLKIWKEVIAEINFNGVAFEASFHENIDIMLG